MLFHIYTDTTPSAVASFSDTRCVADGVSPDELLVFTCKISNAALLRVYFPNGDHDYISLGDTARDVHLPPGFAAESLVITEISDHKRNFSLTLSIANASLLNGGQIICDDTNKNQVMAGCPLARKPSVRVDSV